MRALHRAALVLLSAGLVSCVSFYEARYPLSPQARRVEIAPSGQERSVELAERCRRVGPIESVMSEHFAKLEAAKAGANVAQVLMVALSNGRPYRLDVRFWRCPD